MTKRETEENPWSRDDLKVVYHCDGAPHDCNDCIDQTRCDYVLNFGLEKNELMWMFHLAVALLKQNKRKEAQSVLSSYLSMVDGNFDATQEILLKGITEGMPQTADLWRSLSVILSSSNRYHEARVILQEAIELYPVESDLLYNLYSKEIEILEGISNVDVE